MTGNINMDRIIFNMSYEDFVKWREDGYMSYLKEVFRDWLLIQDKKADKTDYTVIENFIYGEYDMWDDFTKLSILSTLRVITRYIYAEIGCIEYTTFIRDKGISKVLD